MNCLKRVAAHNGNPVVNRVDLHIEALCVARCTAAISHESLWMKEKRSMCSDAVLRESSSARDGDVVVALKRILKRRSRFARDGRVD